MILAKTDLAVISGGGLSATMLNAISRCVTTFYGIGLAIGSSLRRLIGGKACRI